MRFEVTDARGVAAVAEIEDDGVTVLRLRSRLARGHLEVTLGRIAEPLNTFRRERATGSVEQIVDLPVKFALEEVQDPDLKMRVKRLPDDVLLAVAWRAR